MPCLPFEINRNGIFLKAKGTAFLSVGGVAFEFTVWKSQLVRELCIFGESHEVMTLQEFFDTLAANPIYIVAYFLIIPITALVVAWITNDDESHLSPWKYIYSGLIYLVAVPGIFAVLLSVYLFLFEWRSILQTDIFTQILPVLSMVLTLGIIRRDVDLDYIPGFDKLGGLLMIITALLAIMWIVDRTRLLVFTYVPFQYVLLIIAGLLVLIRFGWKRIAR